MKPSVLAGALFVGIALSHDYLFGGVDNAAYYWTAALADYLCVMLLVRIAIQTRVTEALAWLSAVSIGINLLGLGLYLFWADPGLYDNAMIALYGGVAAVLIYGDRGDVGRIALGGGMPWFFGPYGTGGASHS